MLDTALAGDASAHEGEVALLSSAFRCENEDAIAAAHHGVAFFQVAHEHAMGSFLFNDNHHVHALANDA